MMEKRCKECGIIFTTDDEDDTLCTLCKDDRNNTEGGVACA